MTSTGQTLASILITWGYQRGVPDSVQRRRKLPPTHNKANKSKSNSHLKQFTHQQAIHFSLVYILLLIRQTQGSDQLFDWTRKKTRHSQFTSCLWFCVEIFLFEYHACLLWFQKRFSCLPHFFSFPTTLVPSPPVLCTLGSYSKFRKVQWSREPSLHAG